MIAINISYMYMQNKTFLNNQVCVNHTFIRELGEGVRGAVLPRPGPIMRPVPPTQCCGGEGVGGIGVWGNRGRGRDEDRGQANGEVKL